MQAPAGIGALLDAADAGNIDRVRELLGEGGVGVNDAGGGWTALHCASGKGHVALVNMLIEAAGATQSTMQAVPFSIFMKQVSQCQQHTLTCTIRTVHVPLLWS